MELYDKKLQLITDTIKGIAIKNSVKSVVLDRKFNEKIISASVIWEESNVVSV